MKAELAPVRPLWSPSLLRETYPPAVWDGTTEILGSVVDLKTRYCRWLDEKDWDRWTALFTADATMQVGPSKASAIQGRAAIRKLLTRQLKRATTHHQARDPELREDGPGRNRVVWRMKDRVETPLYLLQGAGFYEDTYVQTEAGWKIAAIRLHRSSVDLHPKSIVMRGILQAHHAGLLKRLSPSADRTLHEALYVGLAPGERP